MSSSKDGVRWASSPDSLPPPIGRIAEILPGEQKEFHFLSEKGEKACTHFFGGRTLPCLGQDEECPIDHRTTSRRIQVWFGVQPVGRPEVQFLCATEAAVRDCPALTTEGSTLRGKRIRVGRSASGKRGRLYICFDPYQTPAQSLLPAPDVAEFLARLWHRPLVDALKAMELNKTQTITVSPSVLSDAIQAIKDALQKVGVMP